MSRNLNRLISFALFAFIFTALIASSAYAANPSSNIHNGDIWRYDADGGGPITDADFNEPPIGDTEIRISQQVIADLGDGVFDVELTVESGKDVSHTPQEAVVFLIDCSSSISNVQLGYQYNACKNMILAFDPDIDIQFGVVAFNTTARVVQGLTSDKIAVINALVTLRSNGNTNLYSGVELAAEVLNEYDGAGPKHIILITDGYPNALPPGVADSALFAAYNKINEVKRSGIFMYIAGVRGAVGTNQQFFTLAASRADICKIVSSYEALEEVLTDTDPVSGFLGSIEKNAEKNVAITTHHKFDFMGVILENGGGYDITAQNGVLYWSSRPKAVTVYAENDYINASGTKLKTIGNSVLSNSMFIRNYISNFQSGVQTEAAPPDEAEPDEAEPDEGIGGVSSLIYRVRLNEYTRLDFRGLQLDFNNMKQMRDAAAKLFTPVSASAAISYTVSGNAHTVGFDIPEVCRPVEGEHVHVWGEWEVTIEPTCDEDGEMTRVCEGDPEHIQTKPVNNLGHSYELAEHMDATSDENGYDLYVCEACGDSYETLLPATGSGDIVSVTPEARVEKLAGNKNRLYITVTVVYEDGSAEVFEWDGLIDNNAADAYEVGDYIVYVDTKGNVQIRECYIVESVSVSDSENGSGAKILRPIKLPIKK